MNKAYIAGLFSVIVPTYNRENILVEALDSVWNQTYRPIELIIIDDGSSDETRTLIESWQKQNLRDKEFSLTYKYQPNQGASAARNHGLRICQGEYIQFLDSDDRLYPERLILLAAEFNATACDFIQTGFEGFCAHCGVVLDSHYANPNEDQLNLALKGQLWANTLRSAFRRKLLIRTGFWNEQMHCFEDYEYVLRALLMTKKNRALQGILASARRGGGARISDVLKTQRGRKMRVHCEEILGNGIKNRSDIDKAEKSNFVSRIYALGFRSNASGWLDSGKRCGELADSIHVELNRLGQRRRFIYNLGRWGGGFYEYLHKIKNITVSSQQSQPHVCRK